MSWVQCIGACINCGAVFAFNPNWVPSSRAVTGRREPVCRSCFDRLNQKRIDMGMPPWPPPHPKAYEAVPEDEINWED